MAFVNLPPNFQDMFYSITDRIAKLETGPNQAMYTAESAQGSSAQASAEAAQALSQAQAANALGVQALAEANIAIAQGTQAITEANAAMVQATNAYNEAIGSLQPSADTIVNASNQITAISTNGITVYSGASSSSGARVVMNSTGLAGYNSSGTATFSVVAATGTATFSGNVTGATITGGTLNIGGNAIINSSGYLTATGATITGNITATSGTFTGVVYASSGTFTGTITSSNATITGGSLSVGGNFIVTSAGALTATGANITGAITATSGSFTGSIYASSGTIGGFSIYSTYFGTGSLTIDSTGTITGGNANTIYYGYANIGGGSAGSERLIVTGNSNLNGTLIISGNTTSQTHFYSPFATNVTAAANGYWVSSSGRMTYTTASSLRYKHDVVDLTTIPEYDPKKLLALPVRAFRYNEGYVTPTDDRAEALIPGFIAEEVDAIYPIACDYSENNGPESWNDRVILPAMLALIQDQDARIKQLEGK